MHTEEFMLFVMCLPHIFRFEKVLKMSRSNIDVPQSSDDERNKIEDII